MSPTECFYFTMLTFPTEICFANSSTQKSINAAWQTTDILNTGATPCLCQQLAILCPSWNHSFMSEAEEHNLSSAFRRTSTPITPRAALGRSQISLNPGIQSKDMAGSSRCFQGETDIPQNQTDECGSLGGKQRTGLKHKEKMGIMLGSEPLP